MAGECVKNVNKRKNGFFWVKNPQISQDLGDEKPGKAKDV